MRHPLKSPLYNVAHHLFSQMPHYHAEEATQALQKVLGPHYRKDLTNPWIALYKSWSQCRFVEDEGKLLRLLRWLTTTRHEVYVKQRLGDIVWYQNSR